MLLQVEAMQECQLRGTEEKERELLEIEIVLLQVTTEEEKDLVEKEAVLSGVTRKLPTALEMEEELRKDEGVVPVGRHQPFHY